MQNFPFVDNARKCFSYTGRAIIARKTSHPSRPMSHVSLGWVGQGFQMTSTTLIHITQIFLIKLYHTETLGLHVYTTEDTEYIILHFLGSQEHFCLLSLGSCKQNIWVLTWFELQLEFVVEPLSLKIVNKDGRTNTFCLHKKTYICHDKKKLIQTFLNWIYFLNYTITWYWRRDIFNLHLSSVLPFFYCLRLRLFFQHGIHWSRGHGF